MEISRFLIGSVAEVFIDKQFTYAYVFSQFYRSINSDNFVAAASNDEGGTGYFM